MGFVRDSGYVDVLVSPTRASTTREGPIVRIMTTDVGPPRAVFPRAG
jgi:hypothetical protein